jgi:hypothetical protein
MYRLISVLAMAALAVGVTVPPLAGQSRTLCDSDVLSPTEIKLLKAEIAEYLRKKAGPPSPKLVPLKIVPGDSWMLRQYDAVVQAKNPLLVYQLINAHLPLSERLMQNADPEMQREGLWLADVAALRAIDILKDKWLAPRIVEAYMLPNLWIANDRLGEFMSKDLVLGHAALVYKQAGDTEK